MHSNLKGMQNLQEQPVLANSEYCEICMVHFKQLPEGQPHDKSSQHKYNLFISNKFDASPTATKEVDSEQRTAENYCTSCNLKILSKEQMVAHLNGSKHRKMLRRKQQLEKNANNDESESAVDLICSVCNIKTMSKEQLAEHEKGAKHIKMLGKNQSSTGLGNQNQSAVTVNDATGFATDKKKSNKKNEAKIVHLKDRFCDICKIILGETEKAEDHYYSKYHITKTIKQIKCYICNVHFPSQEALDSHKTTFLHVVHLNMRKELSVKGVITKYWMIHPKKITCKLCMVNIYNYPKAKSHFKCRTHLEAFNQWLIEQPVAKDSRLQWYYCDVCDVMLDGTTNIEFHYKGKSHLMKMEQGKSDMDKEEKGQIKKRTSKDDVKEIVFKTSMSFLIPDERKLLEEKLKTELRRFNQLVYHLKRLPLNIALEFLQKCNQELKKLIENAEKSNKFRINKQALVTFLPGAELHPLGVDELKDSLLIDQILGELDTFVDQIYVSGGLPMDVALKILHKYLTDLRVFMDDLSPPKANIATLSLRRSRHGHFRTKTPSLMKSKKKMTRRYLSKLKNDAAVDGPGCSKTDKFLRKNLSIAKNDGNNYY